PEKHDFVQRPRGFLRRQRGPANEIAPLVQLYRPAQPRGERGNVRCDFMAVERIARLEAKAVARPQTGEFEPVWPTGGQHRLSQPPGLGRGMVEFETVLPRVTGPADQAWDSSHCSLA